MFQMEVEIERQSSDLSLDTQLMECIKSYLNNSKQVEKKQLARKLEWLNTTTTVTYTDKNNQQIMKLSDLCCGICKKHIPNVLMMLCHFETVHPDKNFSYLIDDRKLKVQRILQDPRFKSQKQFPEGFVQTMPKKMSEFLKGLMDKIQRDQPTTTKKQFYRYNSIYQEAKDDEVNDSEEEVMGDIDDSTRQRIGSIVDVSKTQKELFILWNASIRKLQSTYGVKRGISHRQLVDHLRVFVQEKALKNLRTEFVINLSVLLSYGKINRKDMLELICDFDRLHKDSISRKIF